MEREAPATPKRPRNAPLKCPDAPRKKRHQLMTDVPPPAPILSPAALDPAEDENCLYDNFDLVQECY